MLAPRGLARRLPTPHPLRADQGTRRPWRLQQLLLQQPVRLAVETPCQQTNDSVCYPDTTGTQVVIHTLCATQRGLITATCPLPKQKSSGPDTAPLLARRDAGTRPRLGTRHGTRSMPRLGTWHGTRSIGELPLTAHRLGSSETPQEASFCDEWPGGGEGLGAAGLAKWQQQRQLLPRHSRLRSTVCVPVLWRWAAEAPTSTAALPPAAEDDEAEPLLSPSKRCGRRSD